MAHDKESIWRFYFAARWQTMLTTWYLIVAAYLCFFYIGNIWNALQFAYYTLITSAEMLGLNFALWGIVFEISVVVPFLASLYAIFLLPKIWQSGYRASQKTLLTIVLVVLVPMLIVITDTLARYALESDALREFVQIHKIV